MEVFDVYEKAEKFADDLMNSQNFIKLKKLKLQIDEELASLVNDFKIKREKFEQNKQYIGFNDSIKNIQKEFVSAKEMLYKQEIVQEYFKLERVIQSELNNLAKNIKLSISSRFK